MECPEEGTDSMVKVWFGIALAILVPWQLFFVCSNDRFDRPPSSHGDGPDYESIAYSLSQGNGFCFSWDDPQWRKPYESDPDARDYSQLSRTNYPGPTTSRPPLFPLMLSSLYQVAERGPVAFSIVRSLSAIFTAMAGALATGLAVTLMRRWEAPLKAQQLAGAMTIALAALDRTIRTYSVDFLTEPLALCLTTLLVIALLQTLESKSFAKLMVAASLFSLVILTRSIAIFWLPGIVLLIWIADGKWMSFRPFFFAFIVIALMSPWWVRNCWVLGEWMPLGGQGAASLRGGYCDEALADWGNWHGDAEDRIQHRLDQLKSPAEWKRPEREVALAKNASAETKEWIRTHIADLPQMVAMRLVTHWGPYWGPSLVWRLAILIGIVRILIDRRREAIWLIGLLIVNTLAVICLYEAGGRFLVPMYGLMYCLASIGLQSLVPTKMLRT